MTDAASERLTASRPLPMRDGTPLGRVIYGRRIATVEPVFGNVQNKGMRRFTLRGTGKVSMQWKLFTLVHNIEKIGHSAAA